MSRHKKFSYVFCTICKSIAEKQQANHQKQYDSPMFSKMLLLKDCRNKVT